MTSNCHPQTCKQKPTSGKNSLSAGDQRQSPVLLWNSTLCCVVTQRCAQAVLRGKSWHHGFGPDAKARREGRKQMLSKAINSGHFKDYIQEHKTSKKQGRDRKVSPFTPSWLRVIWLCCVSRSSLHSTLSLQMPNTNQFLSNSSSECLSPVDPTITSRHT